MQEEGKFIKIILPDGKADSRVEITLGGSIKWPGIAYRIQREAIDSFKDYDALKQSGVYFLYGMQVDEYGKSIHHLYIGQAGIRKNGQGILARIKEHKKEYWTEAIALVDKENAFGQTEICYLENRFTNIAKEVKSKSENYIIENGNEPNVGNVTKDQKWELEAFIKGALLIFESLRYNFFIPEDKVSSVEDLFSCINVTKPEVKPDSVKESP